MQKKHVTSIILACILFILTGCNSNTTDQTMAMDDLKIGDYIEFGKYDEQPILWRVIHIDEDGNPLIFSDRILSLKVFDAKGSYHKNEDRKELGSNYWKDSNIRQWLNSSENTGEIKWIQNPPNKNNVFNFDEEERNFAYDKEKGFLADGNFIEDERNIIKPVLHKTLLSETDEDKKEGGKSILYPNNDIELAVSNYNDAYYQNLEDKAFLLDVNEIHDYVWENREILGEEYYIGKPTEVLEKKVNNYDLKQYIGTFSKNTPFSYYLRTPFAHTSSSLRIISDNGAVSDASATSVIFGGGIRPALFIEKSNATIVSGKGTESKPFTVTKK